MCVLKECGDAAVIVVVAAEAHHQEFRRRVAQSRGPESAVTRVATKTNDIASSFEFHVIACEFIFCA
jgi:hypothetical protein